MNLSEIVYKHSDCPGKCSECESRKNCIYMTIARESRHSALAECLEFVETREENTGLFPSEWAIRKFIKTLLEAESK